MKTKLIINTFSKKVISKTKMAITRSRLKDFIKDSRFYNNYDFKYDLWFAGILIACKGLD